MATASACADDAPAAHTTAAAVTPVRVGTVTSQRCHRPMLHHGVGTHLSDGRVLTAAHVVDGDLRRLEVDGQAAEVVALDPRLDLAVVRVAAASDRTVPAPVFSIGPVGADDVVAIATPDGTSAVVVERVVTLRVTDVDDGVVHERDALELAGAVDRGTSGAPVLDASGAIVGVVVLSEPVGDVTYAVAPPPDPDSIGAASVRRGCVTD